MNRIEQAIEAANKAQGNEYREAAVQIAVETAPTVKIPAFNPEKVVLEAQVVTTLVRPPSTRSRFLRVQRLGGLFR